MNKTHLQGAAFVLLCLYAASSWSVMLDIRNGLLHGAQEVQVGDTLYDVAFADSSCIALYDNCDEPSDFPFASHEEASIANLALLDQVFLDTAAGLFDTVPTLTFGCEDAHAGRECALYSPVGDRDPTADLFVSSVLFNHIRESRDIHTGFTSSGRQADFSVAPGGRVYMLWSLSGNGGGGGNGGGTTPVPIPGTFYLILVGLLALTARRYQRY